MTCKLSGPPAANRWRDRVNTDGLFGLVSRDMTLNVAIEAHLLKFRDGALQAIDRFVPLTEPVDISIHGNAEFWDKLLSRVPPPRYQNLYAGVRAGTCTVTGNGELYNAYFSALSRLTEIMRNERGA